ncbi:hypothetical protein P43SY_009980 [Pythium insidiosum]|uniref:Calmodulin n=1 Tax=Pythium insidiosum TaxID=114742 RepID=A0AAD5M321_PYTIN|nr:hypothetical protein P43SY_009980 [Pythium insidiosum]
MSIHFKFKAAKEFDTVTFPGTVIRVIDLKKAIVDKKKLNKGLDFDLVITDAQNGKVYDDENMQLPRNTSVTVKRIPSQQPGGGLLARMKAEAAAAAAAASVSAAAIASPVLPVGVAPVIPSAPLTVVADPTKAVDASGGAQTMEDELAALQSIHEQAEDMRGSRLGNKTWTASGGSNSDRVTNYYVGAQQGGGAPGGGPGRGGGFYGGRGGRGPGGMGAGGFQGPGGDMMGGRGGRGMMGYHTMTGKPPPNYVCFRCGTPGHFIQNCPTNGDPEYDQHRVKKKTGIPKSFMKAVSDPSEIPSACDECLRGALIDRKLTCPLCSTPNMSPEKLLPNKVTRTSVEEFLRRARTEQQEREQLVKEAEEKALAKQKAAEAAASSARRTGDSADATLEIKKGGKKDAGPDVIAAQAAIDAAAEKKKDTTTEKEKKPESPAVKPATAEPAKEQTESNAKDVKVDQVAAPAIDLDFLEDDAHSDGDHEATVESNDNNDAEKKDGDDKKVDDATSKKRSSSLEVDEAALGLDLAADLVTHREDGVSRRLPGTATVVGTVARIKTAIAIGIVATAIAVTVDATVAIGTRNASGGRVVTVNSSRKRGSSGGQSGRQEGGKRKNEADDEKKRGGRKRNNDESKASKAAASSLGDQAKKRSVLERLGPALGMGIFNRSRRPSRSKVAEGGEGLVGDAAPAAAGGGGGAGAASDLALFGADSDESDDDATIERYAGGGPSAMDDGDDAGEKDDESRKVSTLLSKLSPEELFKRYDADGSGFISATEFMAMLPDLGIRISEAKAMRIFKKCDTDGGGEIDLNEFKMAMFAVDPVSGNTLGFAPSSLLAPRDAFDLFDEDGTGQIDELEFADVLEYFGMNVSDARQEALFKKYDKDKSGYIDYKEFRAMWLRLTNVREELSKRGIEIPKYATPWKLQQMLETALEEEEAREAQVLAEAKRFLELQREKQRRAELGRKAVIRAQDELAAALDAAGQVYVLGTGRYEQFAGQAVERDDDQFPGFHDVSRIWAFRVDPQPSSSASPPKTKASSPEEPTPKSREKSQDVVATQSQQALTDAPKAKQRFVRRRPENQRWTFRSPPKLTAERLKALKTHIKQLHQAREPESDDTADAKSSAHTDPATASAEVVDLRREADATDVAPEEVARLLYQDREFIRSLRFRDTVLMKNTGSLWGRGCVTGAMSEDVAFAVTSNGSVFTWGGKHNTWEQNAVRRITVLDDDDDDDAGGDEKQADDKRQEVSAESTEADAPEKVTPRSTLVKMCAREQLRGVVDPTLERREEEQLEAELRQQEEEKRYARLKMVVQYFGLWEPPPSNATRVLFMEQVLLPRLDFDVMMQALAWRGVAVERVTKMDLILLLGECFELEVEIRGLGGHEELKARESAIRGLIDSKEKNAKERLEQWEELKRLRDTRRARAKEEQDAKDLERLRRLDSTFEAMAERRHVQLEDLVPDFTARGTNAKIDVSGITTRSETVRVAEGSIGSFSPVVCFPEDRRFTRHAAPS